MCACVLSFRVFGLVSVSFAFRFRACVLSVVEILINKNAFPASEAKKKTATRLALAEVSFLELLRGWR